MLMLPLSISVARKVVDRKSVGTIVLKSRRAASRLWRSSSLSASSPGSRQRPVDYCRPRDLAVNHRGIVGRLNMKSLNFRVGLPPVPTPTERHQAARRDPISDKTAQANGWSEAIPISEGREKHKRDPRRCQWASNPPALILVGRARQY
jgi:hypothetical protein